ncbi:MAG: hypothetical protein ACI9AP_000732 [Flavobacteriales bacterium]
MLADDKARPVHPEHRAGFYRLLRSLVQLFI